ncbi:M23 family metallopeptidase [Halobacteriovorax sp. HLS]|uniref:M23 family metallopeptidase n=1 Tax=Halobacteriovorax sp. HLS TaxID=2234000 RepID=UPI000FDB7D5D|nr:M23 family metallopeptidase [Halobacteriovorax sp. HLS]
MKWILSIYLLLFLVSCATISPIKKEFSSINKIKLTTGKIHNGTVKKISLLYPFKLISADLYCHDIRMVTSAPKNGRVETYLSANRHRSTGHIDCEYRFTVDKLEKKISVASFKIVEADYPLKTLKVAKKYAKLSDENLERWKVETAHMKTVYEGVIRDRKLFNGPFKKPLNSKITAIYGSKRVFNDMKHSWHSGIDFRARPGTKIPSSNRGKVILARHHFFTGKTIILDHGMGILTMYCHLNEFKVAEGDIVPQGAIIGLSGNTGRSSGPHLHWGVRVNENWINGFTLLDI